MGRTAMWAGRELVCAQVDSASLREGKVSTYPPACGQATPHTSYPLHSCLCISWKLGQSNSTILTSSPRSTPGCGCPGVGGLCVHACACDALEWEEVGRTWIQVRKWNYWCLMFHFHLIGSWCLFLNPGSEFCLFADQWENTGLGVKIHETSSGSASHSVRGNLKGRRGSHT